VPLWDMRRAAPHSPQKKTFIAEVYGLRGVLFDHLYAYVPFVQAQHKVDREAHTE